MGLQITWFIIVAIFWTGFFVLEGFDLGVGILHMVVGKTDTERRVAINTIGPFWTPTRCGSSWAAQPSSQRSRPGTPPGSRRSTWR